VIVDWISATAWLSDDATLPGIALAAAVRSAPTAARTGVTWVAVAAFVLSVASLCWQVFTVVQRRPRLRIGLHEDRTTEIVPTARPDATGASVAHRRPAITLRVIVSNVGAEPTTVYDAGLRSKSLDLPLRSLDGATGKYAGIDALFRVEQEELWSGPPLPVEVPGRGIVEWSLSPAVVRSLKQGERWKAYVDQYRAGKKPKSRTSRRFFSSGD
jgi:hypothetical protein